MVVDEEGGAEAAKRCSFNSPTDFCCPDHSSVSIFPLSIVFVTNSTLAMIVNLQLDAPFDSSLHIMQDYIYSKVNQDFTCSVHGE